MRVKQKQLREGAAVLPEYTILFSWDSEAAVWIATSVDIPGLVLESGSLDALVECVKVAVPDLLLI